MPGPLPITSSWVKLNGKEIQLGIELTLRDPSESLSGAVNSSGGSSSPRFLPLRPSARDACGRSRLSSSPDLLLLQPRPPQPPKRDLLPSCFLEPPNLSASQQEELPSPGERVATLTRSSRTGLGVGRAATSEPARSDTEQGSGLGERALPEQWCPRLCRRPKHGGDLGLCTGQPLPAPP